MTSYEVTVTRDSGLWAAVVSGRDVTHLLETLAGSERAYADAAAARDQVRREVIRALADAHLSQSAIGDVIGLSHQRVHQLLKLSGSAPTAAARNREQCRPSARRDPSPGAGGQVRSG